MRVLIINQHTENFGDDAAGEALIQLLRKSREIEDVRVIYNGPQGNPSGDSLVSAPTGVRLKDIGLVPIAAYLVAPRLTVKQSLPLRRLLNVIDTSDAVIVAPAGANLGIYTDWQFLIRLIMVVREGKTPIFHWNTIGGSESRVFDRLAAWVLRRSKIYVREEASRKYVESLGLTCAVGYDTAFALAPLRVARSTDLLTVVPSELDSWHPYFRERPINDEVLREVAPAIAEFALKEGLRVEVLPHLRSPAERKFNSNFIKALKAAGLPSERIAFREDIEHVRQYDAAIAASELVIGARYHSVVLAAKNYVPFVSLSYENKMTEVCQYVDLPLLSVDLRRDADLQQRTLDALMNSWSERRAIGRQLEHVVINRLVPRISLPLRDLGVINRD